MTTTALRPFALSLLGVALFAGCAEPSVSFEALKQREASPYEYVFYHQGTPFTGTAASYHANGETKLRRTFVDGRDDGVWTEWYDDGQKRFEGHRKAGQAHGKTTWWYRNGQLRQEGTYDLDRSVGVWREYYETGTPKQETQYVEGLRDGPTVYYDEQGQKVKEEIYRADTLVSTTPADL